MAAFGDVNPTGNHFSVVLEETESGLILVMRLKTLLRDKISIPDEILTLYNLDSRHQLTIF